MSPEFHILAKLHKTIQSEGNRPRWHTSPLDALRRDHSRPRGLHFTLTHRKSTTLPVQYRVAESRPPGTLRTVSASNPRPRSSRILRNTELHEFTSDHAGNYRNRFVRNSFTRPPSRILIISIFKPRNSKNRRK